MRRLDDQFSKGLLPEPFTLHVGRRPVPPRPANTTGATRGRSKRAAMRTPRR